MTDNKSIQNSRHFQQEEKTMYPHNNTRFAIPLRPLYDITNVLQANDTTRDGIVSDEIREIFLVMNFVILCKILCVLGTITNIINVIVFVKLGIKDPVNSTLLALALSDLGGCFSLIWLTVCYNPMFQQLDLPFDPADFHYLTSGWIHNAFTKITICITAFITFERCLCVAAPLKVKAIITRKRVVIFLIFVALFVIACISPIFYTARHVWIFNEERNRTILSLVFTDDSVQVNKIAYPIHSIFIPIAPFFVVVVSTIILVVKLRQKAKWRENVASAANSLSSRDAKVSKMVVMVATLFIICFIPMIVSVGAMLSVPDLNIKRRYENVFLVMFSYHFSLETLNSSVNIFIYYRMSSNYRAAFNQLFKIKEKETKG